VLKVINNQQTVLLLNFSDLHTAIKRKHPSMLMRGIIMLHNNAHPNVAHTVQDTLHSMLWKVLDHPSYSPDVSSCDFHVFGSLKKVFSGHRFESNEEVKAVVVQ
jgi:hypothetical protein